ncbi:MAG: hypothetical protein ABI606_06755 [Rhodoferax sp.]
MSDKSPLPQEQAKADVLPARAPLDASVQAATLRQHQHERLARLFRRAGEGADDRYLLDTMTRYRGIEPS